MSPGHLAAHNEPRAPQYAAVTQVVTAFVTANSPSPAPSADYPPPVQQAQQPSYRVGPPVAPTQPAQNAVPKPTPAYNAPPRQQRPQPKEPSTNYNAPTRHQRPQKEPEQPKQPQQPKQSKQPQQPKQSKQNPPVRQQRPQPHPSKDIPAPKSIHHHAGQPILHAKTSSPLTDEAALPTVGAGTKHVSNSSPPNKVTTDDGMSGGAKAGLAIGLILLIGLIAGLAFFFYRKKKNQNEAHQPLDDEKSNLQKSNSVASHVSVRRTVANAPRLSLRPVTEMFPTMAEKQDSNSASNFITNSAASARTRTPELPRLTPSPEDKINPFDDHAATATTTDDSTVTAPAAVVPKPLSIKSERTGTGISEGSVSSDGQTTGAAGANGRRMSPPGPGPNNVHRVQLDFNPSMDDELGLRAGQLVRMLHEYDDGWALCVRLDRSQQGVVPRTCLSKLPVKPRPQGPPQGSRGPPPQGRPRGPTNGPAPRMPPNGRLRSQSSAHRQPRPESPGNMNGGRMGGPNARPRANSDAMSARRVTPPNMSSPMNPMATSPTQGSAVPSRKPVPGQAL